MLGTLVLKVYPPSFAEHNSEKIKLTKSYPKFDI